MNPVDDSITSTVDDSGSQATTKIFPFILLLLVGGIIAAYSTWKLVYLGMFANFDMLGVAILTVPVVIFSYVYIWLIRKTTISIQAYMVAGSVVAFSGLTATLSLGIPFVVLRNVVRESGTAFGLTPEAFEFMFGTLGRVAPVQMMAVSIWCIVVFTAIYLSRLKKLSAARDYLSSSTNEYLRQFLPFLYGAVVSAILTVVLSFLIYRYGIMTFYYW